MCDRVRCPSYRRHQGVQNPNAFGAGNEIPQYHGRGVEETADGSDLHGPEVYAPAALEDTVDLDVDFDEEEVGESDEGGGGEFLAGEPFGFLGLVDGVDGVFGYHGVA